MQMQPLFCSHRPFNLSPPRHHPSPAHESRRLSTSKVSRHERGFPRMIGTIRSGHISKGCLCRGWQVSSYIPESENSTEMKEAVTSAPASSLQTTSVPPASATARTGYSGRMGVEPFNGKSGSVSFCGLTYQALEERKLVSSPFNEGTGSLYWLLGPVALISSLLLPQLFLTNALEGLLRDEFLAEIVALFSSEFIFYAGLAAFLSITDHVQRPYLEFSPRRWSLITGLKGYLSSVFFVMGFKVFAPLLAVYVVWPVIGLPALVAVLPYLLGCAAQFAFELYLDKRNFSCWPLLPIIFELYRLYQLNKGAHLIQRLMFSLSGSSLTPALLERSNALVSMVAVVQILGVLCLWSLTTFLLRLSLRGPWQKTTDFVLIQELNGSSKAAKELTLEGK